MVRFDDSAEAQLRAMAAQVAMKQVERNDKLLTKRDHARILQILLQVFKPNHPHAKCIDIASKYTSGNLNFEIR